FSETIFYCIHPLYVGHTEHFNKVTNETTIVKVLPLSSWLPYNAQEHYLCTYLWQIFDGTIGASYVGCTDVFTFSLIIYPLGQIKMLIHILRNFHKYVGKTQNVLGVERDEASFLTMRECILKHKEIIRLIETVSVVYKRLQLRHEAHNGTGLFTKLSTAGLDCNTTFPGRYKIQLQALKVTNHGFASIRDQRVIPFFISYNVALLQSSNVALAVWQSEWYEEPQKVKQMMLMMIRIPLIIKSSWSQYQDQQLSVTDRNTSKTLSVLWRFFPGKVRYVNSHLGPVRFFTQIASLPMADMLAGNFGMSRPRTYDK
ncbi:hypothetical protein NQ317_009136, partial [Molorchus minor]